jgi:hypothetical protein
MKNLITITISIIILVSSFSIQAQEVNSELEINCNFEEVAYLYHLKYNVYYGKYDSVSVIEGSKVNDRLSFLTQKTFLDLCNEPIRGYSWYADLNKEALMIVNLDPETSLFTPALIPLKDFPKAKKIAQGTNYSIYHLSTARNHIIYGNYSSPKRIVPIWNHYGLVFESEGREYIWLTWESEK